MRALGCVASIRGVEEGNEGRDRHTVESCQRFRIVRIALQRIEEQSRLCCCPGCLLHHRLHWSARLQGRPLPMARLASPRSGAPPDVHLLPDLLFPGRHPHLQPQRNRWVRTGCCPQKCCSLREVLPMQQPEQQLSASTQYSCKTLNSHPAGPVRCAGSAGLILNRCGCGGGLVEHGVCLASSGAWLQEPSPLKHCVACQAAARPLPGRGLKPTGAGWQRAAPSGAPQRPPSTSGACKRTPATLPSPFSLPP